MSFNIEEVMEVLKIVKESKDVELHIDTGEMKLSLFKGEVKDSSRSIPFGLSNENPVDTHRQAAPEQKVEETPKSQPQETSPHLPKSPSSEQSRVSDDSLLQIKANVTSVFYRSPNPGEPPFVQVGDQIEENAVVCMLEVMKCFRQVMSGVRGKIVEICVVDGDLVEEGKVMFLVQPE